MERRGRASVPMTFARTRLCRLSLRICFLSCIPIYYFLFTVCCLLFAVRYLCCCRGGLLTLLPTDDLCLVSNALAFVRFGLSHSAHLRRKLTNALLIRAGDRYDVLFNLDCDSLGDRTFDRVRISHHEL